MKMKRIVSVLIAIAMVCSFAGINAFASWNEVTETKRFEFYNWASTFKEISSNREIGKYVKAETGVGQTEATTITGTVTLSETEGAYYDITYLMSYMKNATAASPVKITIDGNVIGSNNIVGIDMTDLYTSSITYAPMHKYIKRGVWLDKGEHTVTLTADISNNARKFFQADWIEFEQAAKPRFEFEDFYAPSVAGRGTDTVWSWQATSVGGATENKVVTIPVKIKETGTYNVTYVAGYKKSASAITLKLSNTEGDKTIGTNAKAGEDLTSIYTNLTSNAPMHKYVKEGLEIAAGDYELNIVIEPTSNQRRIFNFDYIEFDFMGGPEDGPQKYEFYDWATAYKKTSDVAEIGTYIMSEAGVGQTGTTYVTGKVTLSETKGAYYDITYLMSYKKNTTGASPLTLSIDGEVIGTNAKEGIDLSSVYTKNPTYTPMHKYIKKGIWLDKGEHTVELAIGVSANTRRMFQADWIEFNRADNPRFEIEDFYAANINGKGTETVYAWDATSADTVITEDKVITIPVKIAETGNYDVTYIVGYKKSSSLVSLSLVNGESKITIGTNAKEGEDLTSVYKFLVTEAPMNKYVTENLEIPAGDYELKIVIKPTANNRRIAMLDYVQFALPSKAENKMTVKDGVVTAVAAYAEAVSGTPVLALYNDKQLVETFIGEAVEETNIVTFNVTTEETVNKAKIFIWDDTVNIIPQATSIIFAD